MEEGESLHLIFDVRRGQKNVYFGGRDEVINTKEDAWKRKKRVKRTHG